MSKEQSKAQEKARNWTLHFAGRESISVTCIPNLTHEEILARYPEAVAAEPAADPVAADLHIGERMEISRWLKQIGEDAAGIAAILAGIEQDAGAKAYYLSLARERRAA